MLKKVARRCKELEALNAELRLDSMRYQVAFKNTALASFLTPKDKDTRLACAVYGCPIPKKSIRAIYCIEHADNRQPIDS